ncbi:MAG: thioredoxin TrxC [Magnetovibrio sp.]|nr:thioredoxin TrxC [Magnetovibrio sp.]
MHETYQTACPHCSEVNRFPKSSPPASIKCRKCDHKMFSAHPIELNGETFHHHLTSNDIPVVVDFWAEWCAPCKMIAPELAKAATELEPHVRFAKVDTDEEQKLAGQNGIRGFPTLVIYKGGREISRHAGAMSAGQIKTWIREFL